MEPTITDEDIETTGRAALRVLHRLAVTLPAAIMEREPVRGRRMAAGSAAGTALQAAHDMSVEALGVPCPECSEMDQRMSGR